MTFAEKKFRFLFLFKLYRQCALRSCFRDSGYENIHMKLRELVSSFPYLFILSTKEETNRRVHSVDDVSEAGMDAVSNPTRWCETCFTNTYVDLNNFVRSSAHNGRTYLFSRDRVYEVWRHDNLQQKASFYINEMFPKGPRTVSVAYTNTRSGVTVLIERTNVYRFRWNRDKKHFHVRLKKILVNLAGHLSNYFLVLFYIQTPTPQPYSFESFPSSWSC